MTRHARHIVIPVSLWASRQLTLFEKAVLIEMDSFTDENGQYVNPIGKLATSLGVNRSEVKRAIQSLYEKGAVEIARNENGDEVFTPLINRRKFVPRNGELVEISDDEPQQYAIDYDDVLRKWKETNPNLRQPRCFTPKMQTQLRNTLRNNKAEISDLYRLFRIVALSRFLQGSNDRGWQASLDWIISDRNSSFGKILSGAYCNTADEKYKFNEIAKESATDTDESDPLAQFKEYYK